MRLETVAKEFYHMHQDTAKDFISFDDNQRLMI